MKLSGTWHITEMDEWSESYFNCEVQAYLKLDRQGNGQFQFGLVCGHIVDGELDEGGEEYEFRWEGNDEMDEAAGSCLLRLIKKDLIAGDFEFDNGTNSGFLAERAKSPGKTGRRKT